MTRRHKVVMFSYRVAEALAVTLAFRCLQLAHAHAHLCSATVTSEC